MTHLILSYIDVGAWNLPITTRKSIVSVTTTGVIKGKKVSLAKSIIKSKNGKQRVVTVQVES